MVVIPSGVRSGQARGKIAEVVTTAGRRNPFWSQVRSGVRRPEWDF